MLVNCWDGNAKKRPSFQSIVENYNDLYLDFMLGEKNNVVKSWLKNEFFSEPLTEVQDNFNIPFDFFLEKFCCKFLGLSEPIHPTQQDYVLFQYLLKEKEHVNVNNFSYFIKFCVGFVDNQKKDSKSPYVKNGKKWIETLKDDFMIEGWYGNLPKEEAASLLKSAGSGQYLLRFSTSPGAWVVSFKNKNRIINIKIDHDPFSLIYQIKSDDGKTASFHSLRESFEFVKKTVGLQSPATICPPNQRIFEEGKNDPSSNYVSININ